MRSVLAAVVALAACSSPHADDPVDAPPGGHPDAPVGPHPDAPVAPPSDAASPADAAPDAIVAPCDTVTADRQVAPGDVVTTCLSTDADVDTYRFTAPADPSGGLLRMKLDFTDCQISFALWLDNDPTYPNIQSDDSFDTMYVGQLDHNLVQVTYPGLGYHLVVKKRRPFAGSCSYTLTTTYAPIADPYEPDQDAVHAKALTVGTTATAYFACVAADRDPSISDDCDDLYTIALPAGQYQMGYSAPSVSLGINPCLYVGCYDNTTNAQTYNYFQCQAASGLGHGFSSIFTIASASHCYVRMSGSTAGWISTGYAEPAPPSAPKGTDQPYTFLIAVKP